MSEFTDVLTLVGAVTGLIAFTWNIWTAIRSYLALSLDIREPNDGMAIIRVSVENSGITSKMISYAALLVAPESMPLADAVGHFLERASPESVKRSRQRNALALLFHRGGDARLQAESCVLVPLNELYLEQGMVGPGETVSHACSIGLPQLRPDVTYVVRFLVYVSYVGVFTRWRFTADAVRISAAKGLN